MRCFEAKLLEYLHGPPVYAIPQIHERGSQNNRRLQRRIRPGDALIPTDWPRSAVPIVPIPALTWSDSVVLPPSFLTLTCEIDVLDATG